MNFPSIPPINNEMRAAARTRQNQLTKPLGSLGFLEDISVNIAGMTEKIAPELTKKSVILMAADHGIAKEGVSPYPQEVTPQMVMNFLNKGAAINVLTRQAKSDVLIVDIGVNYDFKNIPGILHHKVAWGTENMLNGPAMTMQQAESAIQVGMDVTNDAIDHGMQLAATGEMGIGNTTPSAAITAVLCNRPAAEVTGRGTGLDDAGLIRKIKMIEHSIEVNRPDPNDPMDILCKIGGLEIAGMAGVVIAAAARRVPIVLDGLISTVSAAIAVEFVPQTKDYLIAGHQSEEIGHRILLEKLGLRPLVQLNMRVGEGTGAALAFHLIDASLNLLRDMATFEQAGVSDKS
ncbi:MAG: nicotinate-nucleotide--dimethylbenzimidazole phosphoribosyltransferase [Flexilinea sp.]